MPLPTPALPTCPDHRASDEVWWASIRSQYDVPDDFINLENGYFGMLAQPVFSEFLRLQTEVNRNTSFLLREYYPQALSSIMQQLADLCGVGADELILTRNLVESMNILLQGYPFAAGDEVIHAPHDYDKVLETLFMVAQRKQLKLVEIRLPLDPDSDEQIVACYERAITPRTRAILLTHLLHLTGQILPVAKITAMARRHGVDVLVDSAHAFAQLDFRLPDLGADFVAVNLHKWLGAPLGLALLYIRKNRIADITPWLGSVQHDAHDIAKLGAIGTIAPAPVLTIPAAIAFHQQIGVARKQARLSYLTQYWLDRARQMPRVRCMTPRDPGRSCAIASFAIDGLPAQQVARQLMQQFHIFTVVRALAGVEMVRITVHMSTRLTDLDSLLAAIAALASQADRV